MPARIAISLGASFLGYATHAGFLNRLHDLGVRPVAVGGSSAGALAAGLYAAGLRGERLREAVTAWALRRSFISRTPWFTHYIRNTFFERFPGLFQPEGAVSRLRALVGEARIEDLHEPRFLAAVSDLETARTHFLQEGPLAEAMVASCCVPTVFQPVHLAGMRCFDGGVAHETPMDPWLEDDEVDTIVLHRIEHHDSPWPSVVPLSLINLTARAHACASEQLLAYRLRLAQMHGKRVILCTTRHERPPLLSGSKMASFFTAGEAEAQRLFDSELAAIQ